MGWNRAWGEKIALIMLNDILVALFFHLHDAIAISMSTRVQGDLMIIYTPSISLKSSKLRVKPWRFVIKIILITTLQSLIIWVRRNFLLHRYVSNSEDIIFFVIFFKLFLNEYIGRHSLETILFHLLLLSQSWTILKESVVHFCFLVFISLSNCLLTSFTLIYFA